MQHHTSELVKARDEQIINALKERGYVFANRPELEFFLKTRCKLVNIPHLQKKELHVDDIPVLEWYDTIRLEHDGNAFTAIVGEKTTQNRFSY